LGQNISSLKSAVARAVNGEMITTDEVENIRWEAKGELDKLAQHVWIELMQFCFDDDIRETDPEYDAGKRRKLKWYLDELVQLEEKQSS